MTNLVSFPLVGFRTNLDTENKWNVTHPGSIRIDLDRRGRTTVETGTTESVYIVLGGTARDFKSISPGLGISLQADRAFVVELNTAANRSVRSEIHLLEYNAEGNRLGTTVVEPRHRTLYVPTPEVAWVLPTFRLRGSGRFVLDEFRLDSVTRPQNLSSGTITIADRDSAQTLFTEQLELKHLSDSLSEAVEAGQRAQRKFNDMRSVLERTAVDVSAGGDVAGTSAASRKFSRDLLLKLASTLPESNGSEYFAKRLPYHVAIITDEYMYNFYKDAFEKVTYVHPSEVQKVISDGFDILLYVSCWKGFENDEWRGIKFRETPKEALEALLSYSNNLNKPTVFQTIEDPSNFEYFLPIAGKFDHVFTSDSDCVPKYREALGHDHVAYLEYGANPMLNNPIGSYRHTINKAFFAGSYPKRYQERVNDMHTVFDSILASGENLTIIDRNFGSAEYAFPDKYGQLALEPVKHADLQRMHKLFRWSLNFNSIKSSPTMCAMRVYELQAQGRGLISNYANSVFNKFPEVRIVVAREMMKSYFDDEPSIDELRNNESQIRNVINSRTAFDIASGMLSHLGIDEISAHGSPEAVLIASHVDDRMRGEIDSQTYPAIRLIDLSSEDVLIEDLNDSSYLGSINTDYCYGPNYVQDRVNAFKYTDSDFVTQLSLVEGGRVVGSAHEYVDEAAKGLTLYSNRKLSGRARGQLMDGMAPDAGSGGYSVPPFEATLREDTGVNATESDESWLPELSIIVPVFNAGRFLETKCMPSIDRNMRSGRFEILLIDDGSTDGMTRDICLRLERQRPNVRAFAFEQGGSGSASRPRNRGIELARAPKIAFLDPDNEISDGGYDRLLDLFEMAQAEDPEIKFVSGYQVKVAESTLTTGRHTSSELSVIRDFRRSYFEKGKFPVVSTQAAVMDKSLFDDEGLRFIERAAGQDTLFGWQLLLKAENGAFTDDVHLIYYAERSDSVTNTVDLDYFRKKLIMEQAQSEILLEEGLIESYVNHHFHGFLQNWYMPKLDAVDSADYDSAADIVRSIAALYDIEVEVGASKANHNEEQE